MIQSVGKQVCVRAFWDTHLAHNSPISAILPVLHKNKNTVIIKALDFAHAREQGLFKQFFFTLRTQRMQKIHFRVLLFGTEGQRG